MTPDDLERVRLLEARIGYAFPDARLALRALTHRSFANEHPEHADGNNERLEFLGDSVVSLCVSDHLMRFRSDWHEGELSRLRASLVNASALAAVSTTLGLGQLLRLGKGEEQTGGREKQSLIADAFEAVLGAVYLADGLEACRDLVERHLLSGAKLSLEARDRDYKTRLQEATQGKLSLTPKYSLLSEEGPAHERVFLVEVRVEGHCKEKGAGKSKKAAQQVAAKAALKSLGLLAPGASGVAPGEALAEPDNTEDAAPRSTAAVENT